MAEFLLVLLTVLGIVALLVYVTGRKSRYSEMTDEAFEQEARKGPGSLVGSAVVGLEGALRKREAAIMMEARSRIERDATPAPGEPPEDSHLKKEEE